MQFLTITKRFAATAGVSLLFVTVVTNQIGAAPSGGGGGGGSAALSAVPVPVPPNMGTYVADQTKLVALGKALFWDMQVGVDGKQACASCHFHAGADHR